MRTENGKGCGSTFGLALLGLLLAALALCPTGASCAGPGSSPSDPIGLESMSEPELARFTDRCASAAGIAVGIALDRGGLDAEGQAMLAALVSMLATGELRPAPGGGPLSSLFDDAGLTDNEVRGAFLLAERLLADAGVAFGGEGVLGERAAGVLRALSEAIASARVSP